MDPFRVTSISIAKTDAPFVSITGRSAGLAVVPTGCTYAPASRNDSITTPKTKLGGYSGEGTAGSFSPRIRRLRAVSRPPTALTCSVALARPKTGMLE